MKPNEIPIEIITENGVIVSIQAIVENMPVEFTANDDGYFALATETQIEKPYIFYIIRQLNRVYGSSQQ